MRKKYGILPKRGTAKAYLSRSHLDGALRPTENSVSLCRPGYATEAYDASVPLLRTLTDLVANTAVFESSTQRACHVP